MVDVLRKITVVSKTDLVNLREMKLEAGRFRIEGEFLVRAGRMMADVERDVVARLVRIPVSRFSPQFTSRRKRPPLLIEDVIREVMLRTKIELMNTLEMKAEVIGPAPESEPVRAGPATADVVFANAQLAVGISLVPHKFVEQLEPVIRLGMFTVRVRAGEFMLCSGFALVHLVDVPTKRDGREQTVLVPFAVCVWARVGFRTVYLLQVAV